MKRILVLFFTIHCSLFTIHCEAQLQGQKKIDSLENDLKRLEAAKKELGTHAPALFDTSKVNTLLAICREKSRNSDFAEARKFADEALTLSENIGFEKGIANCYGYIGIFYYSLSDYTKAMEYHQKSLAIHERLGNKNGIVKAYMNIGNTYDMVGNYPEAVNYYYDALKILEDMGDAKGTVHMYTNISLVYSTEENYSEALKILNKGIKIQEKIGNKEGIAVLKCWAGIAYGKIGNYDQAIKNNLEGLKIFEELGDKRNTSSTHDVIARQYMNVKKYDSAMANYIAELQISNEIDYKSGIASGLEGIGYVDFEQSKFDDALKSYLSALKIYEETKNKGGIIDCYFDIGKLNSKQKDFQKALLNYSKGLSIAKEIGSLDKIKNGYSNILEVDSAMSNFKDAFEKRGLYMQINDSLFNTEKSKKINTLQMNYDFDKKQVADSVKAADEKQLISLELKHEQTKRYALYGGLALMILVAAIILRQRNHISKEKGRSDELLLNILPKDVAEELKDTGHSKGKSFEEVTVMFTDFKGFTQISEKLGPEQLVKEIDYCFSAFDNIIHKHGIEKIKTIGDAYLCVGGLPKPNKSHAEDTVKAALEIRDFMANHNKEKIAKGELPFEIRIGINTGPVVAGIVGVKKFAYDIWGDTVNLASRMESSGKEGEVNISGSTYELVKNDFTCIYRGKIQAKNKGEVDMYFVE